MSNKTTPTRMRDRQPATVQDIKAQAGRLRELLGGTSLTHTQALEMVAKIHGYPTWGHLNAHLRDSGSMNSSPATAPGNNLSMVMLDLRDDADPRTAFGLSENEFLARTMWHCHEGTHGLTPADYFPMQQVLQCWLDAGLLSDTLYISEFQHHWQSSDHADSYVRHPLCPPQFESTFRDDPNFQEDLHAPALKNLWHLILSGTLADRPTRPVAPYDGGQASVQATTEYGWLYFSEATHYDDYGGSDTLAHFTGFEECPHAVIFAPSHEDRFDFLDMVRERLLRDRHPMCPIDLHPYSSAEMEREKWLYRRPEWWKWAKLDEGRIVPGRTSIRQHLEEHTGRDLPRQWIDPVDFLANNCQRSIERKISIRAPLVVSLKWHPHDLQLPALLPRLREENIFVVSLVTPAAYTPTELAHLQHLMAESKWWILAPGAELPPLERAAPGTKHLALSGYQRVRNTTRRPLMLRQP